MRAELERSGLRLPREAEGRRLLRAQDRHPDRRTPSGASGRRRRSRSTGSCCPSASTCGTSTRTAGSSARWRSTAPSTARWSGSSASSPSTSPGAFPLWCAPVQAVVIPIADRHLEPAARAGGRPALARASGSRSTTPTPDAEQDPRRPGAEGAVHARAGRPRGRGPHGRAAHARRRAAAGRGLGGPGRSPAAARRHACRLRPLRRPASAARVTCSIGRSARPARPAHAAGEADGLRPLVPARGDCAILRRRTAPGSRVRLHAVRGCSVNSIARRGRP